MPSVLRVSVLVNLVQLLVIGWLVARPSPEPVSRASFVGPTASAAGEGTASSSRAPASVSAPATPGPDLVALLEQAGFSRALVAQALLADFNHRWDRHVLAVEKRYAPRAVPRREYVELGRARDAAFARELKAALGEEGYRAWHRDETLRQVNGADLPLDEGDAEAAYRLHLAFEETHRELQWAMEDGVADLADATELQTKAREKLDRDLEALFGKARLDAMRGHTDPVANVYRTFDGLSPTPEQARAVVASDERHRAAEAALAERLRKDPVDVAEIVSALEEIDARRDEELAGVFGAEARADAARRSDPTYQTIRQFADAWGLEDTSVGPVYSAIDAFNRLRERTLGAAALREEAGQPVAWREIDAALERERQKAEDELRAMIGPERLHRLRRNGLLAPR